MKLAFTGLVVSINPEYSSNLAKRSCVFSVNIKQIDASTLESFPIGEHSEKISNGRGLAGSCASNHG